MNSGLGRAEAALTLESRELRPSRLHCHVRGFGALVWNTWTEVRRGASPLVFVAIGVIAAITASLLPAIGSAARAELLLEIVFGTVTILSTLVLVFVVAPLTPRDLEERTAITILSKPVPRWIFAAGRGVGFTLAAVLFGALAVASSFATLLLIASSDLRGTPQDEPTRLIRGEGPRPEGRLVYLSGFPDELRWLTPNPEGDDSFTEFTFQGQDIRTCLEHSGWLRLELTGLNTRTLPMSEIVDLKLSILRDGAPREPQKLIRKLQDREVRLDLRELPEGFLASISPDETVRIEIRPLNSKSFVEAERGTAELALPKASNLLANYSLVGVGVILTLVVVSWITFSASLIFSAKLSILIGIAFLAIGFAREQLRALLRMVGGSGGISIADGPIDPMQILDEYAALQVQSGGSWHNFLQKLIGSLTTLVPDLTQFDLTAPLLAGFCLSGSDVNHALQGALIWVAVLMVFSSLVVLARRIQ